MKRSFQKVEKAVEHEVSGDTNIVGAFGADLKDQEKGLGELEIKERIETIEITAL